MKRHIYILTLIYFVFLSCSSDDSLLNEDYVRGIRLNNNYAEASKDLKFFRYILDEERAIANKSNNNITPGLEKGKDTFKKDIKKKQKPEDKKSDSIEIKYRRYHFIGLPKEVTYQITTLPKREGFERLLVQREPILYPLKETLIEAEDIGGSIYKDAAVDYLVQMDSYLKFIEFYNERLYDAYLKLVAEAKQLDRSIEEEYITVYGKMNSDKVKNSVDEEKLIVLEKKYSSHKELLKTLLQWNLQLKDFQNSTKDFKILKDSNIAEAFEMYQNNVPKKEVIHFLEIKLADVFHNAIATTY